MLLLVGSFAAEGRLAGGSLENWYYFGDLAQLNADPRTLVFTAGPMPLERPGSPAMFLCAN